MKKVIWFFGLPSAGKTTLATALRDQLQAQGLPAVLLDGDALRSGLCRDLGFSDAERAENIRRAAEMAKLLAGQGIRVICAFITPKEYHRQLVRDVLGTHCALIHVDCPLAVCVARDVKGLYQKAAQQQLAGMTGVQDEFEEPAECELRVASHQEPVEKSLRLVMEFLQDRHAVSFDSDI